MKNPPPDGNSASITRAQTTIDRHITRLPDRIGSMAAYAAALGSSFPPDGCRLCTG